MVDGSIEGLGEMYSQSQTFPLNMPFHVGGLHVSFLNWVISLEMQSSLFLNHTFLERKVLNKEKIEQFGETTDWKSLRASDRLN